jgi:hypothetical protein
MQGVILQDKGSTVGKDNASQREEKYRVRVSYFVPGVREVPDVII